LRGRRPYVGVYLTSSGFSTPSGSSSDWLFNSYTIAVLFYLINI
jgi:hypothetical protein